MRTIWAVMDLGHHILADNFTNAEDAYKWADEHEAETPCFVVKYEKRG